MNKPLYEKDFYAWTKAQADALRRRSTNELDWENLEEEIESMGKQQRSELQSHLAILLQRLLKWRHQPARRSRSWRLSVDEQRRQVEGMLEDNPSLAPAIDEVFDRAYRIARLRALREARLSDKAIPEEPLLSFTEAMTDFLED